MQVSNAAIDSGRFDVMMLAYHHGIWSKLGDVIKRARSEQDMGVVAMKTLKGAQHHDLAGFQAESDAYSQAALKWVLENPDVSCAVISMVKAQQIDEYLYASGRLPTADDLAILEKYDQQIVGTYCAPHCGACPELVSGGRADPRRAAPPHVLRELRLGEGGDASLLAARDERGRMCELRGAVSGELPPRHPDSGAHPAGARAADAVMIGRAAAALAASLFVVAWAGAASAQATNPAWALPPANSCAPEDGLRGWPPGQDAPPIPFEPGDTFELEKLDVLKDYFPQQLWVERDRFFYEGMRLEIGPCFADYSPPAFYQDATAKFRGQAKLLENGGLEDYTAGQPFAPDTFGPDDEKAGLKWAWNIASRYEAAGFRGKFRVSDMVGREGRAEPFEGEIFKIQLAHRADLDDKKYREKTQRGKQWVAGGDFYMPFDARGHAWRQYRDEESLSSPKRTDDLHAYLPDWRRVRRLASAGIEGLYMPSFSVGVVKPATIGGFGAGGGAGGAGVSAAGATGAGADAITTKRSGFEGLEIRPLLYYWTLRGVHDVLAPINSHSPSYPEKDDRAFGPWGLSFASDRWDLRRALVLEARTVRTAAASEVSRMIL